MEDPLDARRPVAAARLSHAGVALLMALAGALALLALASYHPPKASAAPCTVSPYVNYGGGLLVVGASQCGDQAHTKETFIVYCDAGTLYFRFVFEDETGPYPRDDSAHGPCSAMEGVVANGSGGTDGIDFTRVTAADGFTGVTGTNSLDGGAGQDRLLGSGFSDAVTGGADTDVVQVRDARADTVDCGAGFDAVEADQPSLDSLAGCEIVDALAEPPAAILPLIAGPTGQRAAALEKCKKKKTKKKRKKCRAKAQTLPL